jgi:triacylglycerol lipase
VHGILGFDRLGVAGVVVRYFRSLAGALDDLGTPVHFPALPPAGSVAERAGALARHLEKVESAGLLLVAHSMGGLDCRYFTHHYDAARRVRAVATVATPHRGTPLARHLLEDGGLTARLARRIATPGLADLTPASCERFNRAIPDRAGVRYRSWAGCRPPAEMPLCFRPWGRMLQRASGDNDSQVPADSAMWGDFRGRLRADHWELVGWSPGLRDPSLGRPFAHVEFFRSIVSELLADSA